VIEKIIIHRTSVKVYMTLNSSEVDLRCNSNGCSNI